MTSQLPLQGVPGAVAGHGESDAHVAAGGADQGGVDSNHLAYTRLTKGPPEFPGLMDASVRTSSPSSLPAMPLRPTTLTIPEVTVWPRPKGLPNLALVGEDDWDGLRVLGYVERERRGATSV